MIKPQLRRKLIKWHAYVKKYIPTFLLNNHLQRLAEYLLLLRRANHSVTWRSAMQLEERFM